MDVAAVNDWFAVSARDLPWRRPGFSAWGTLVSEFMLQQTQVARVVPILLDWLERWPTPTDLAAAAPADVLRAWGGLGYPRRALALQAAATAIATSHGNRVPRDVDALLALPGIGDYTARAIAVFAYGERHPVVDTNVRRVIARAERGRADAGVPSSRRDLTAMAALLPDDLAAQGTFNAGLMELGAVVCTARTPRCSECPVADGCAWRAAGYPASDAPARPRQPRFEGSDRQRRGRVMRELRTAPIPLTEAALRLVLPDDVERERIVGGLIADGLAVETRSGLALPGG